MHHCIFLKPFTDSTFKPLEYILNRQYLKFVTVGLCDIIGNLVKTRRLFKRFALKQSKKLCII